MNYKRTSSPSSAAVVAGNHDVLMEIFLNLSAKSLIRFQTLNKHRNSETATPSFRHLHSLRHPHGTSGPQHAFLLRATTTSQLYTCHPTVKKLIPFRFRFPYVKILQSYNGLLLLECKNRPHGRKNYYVCNPTTMQSKNLFGSDEHRVRSFSGLFLAFDPSKSPHYKVICLTPTGPGRHEHEHRVAIYDSETHTWKQCGKSYINHGNLCNGIYWNNGIYFVRLKSSSFRFCPQDHVQRWLDKPPIPSAFAGKNGTDMISLLGMIRGDWEEDSLLLLHVPGKIMVYRFCDEVFEVLVDFKGEYYFQEGDQLQFGFKDAHQFVHTLTPV
ncbi:UNVERIFIED_CONTAM: F-box protein [Sesamum latifolium]|uniref:F-box protein n=1 Tax=Sesamum latifolium TaxID=2727402 RepID=A0AAW2XID0_9LAMI